MPNLKDKVALITGASSGIGAGTAIHFASLGCKLAINGRNEVKLANVRQQCLETGLDERKLIIVPGDLNNDEVAKGVVEKTVEYFGGLDILVNNAGINRPQMTLDMSSVPGFDEVMGTNFRTPYRMTMLAAAHLIKSKGNIVNVSSVASTRNFDRGTAYGCSKAALDHLTRHFARDFGPSQVRVNSVNPGVVKTDIMVNSGSSEAAFEMGRKVFESAHALGRIGLPEEIAKPIAFLASDEASFITGAVLLVDGGLNAHPPIVNNMQ